MRMVVPARVVADLQIGKFQDNAIPD